MRFGVVRQGRTVQSGQHPFSNFFAVPGGTVQFEKFVHLAEHLFNHFYRRGVLLGFLSAGFASSCAHGLIPRTYAALACGGWNFLSEAIPFPNSNPNPI